MLEFSHTSLTDLRIIVTGAASGIGQAAARILHARGAKLMLADVNPERLEETRCELSALQGHAPLARCCDVSSATSCDELADQAEEGLGGIDALVHCAGILRPPGGRPQPLHLLEEREFDLVVGVNLKGTFLMNRAVLRKMLPRKQGQIINLSSTSGQRGRPLDSIYSASKAGVIGLSESVSEEVRAFGIRVQVILPDAVDTPLWRQNGPMPAPPPGSLPPERVGELIALCLSLPPDATLERIVIQPFRKGRKQKASAQSPCDDA